MEKYEDLFQPTFLKNKCEKCEERPAIPYDATVTMAYIPLQHIDSVYDAEKALDEGTLFPELNKPFKGRMVKK